MAGESSENSKYWQQHGLSRRAMLRGSSVAGLGLAGAALIGCSSSTPAAPAKAPSAAAPGAAAQPTEQPVVSDGFITLSTRWQPGLDPLEVAATVSERNSLSYGRLIDTVGGPNMKDAADTKMVPGYSVEGWEFGDGGTKLTFKLKKGIKFHNVPPVNGREQVAEDVRWSIERGATLPKSSFKAGYADIAKMETPDNYTIVLTLKRKTRYIMGVLAQEPTFIMPKESDSLPGGVGQNQIGSGPFIFEKLIQNEGAFFRKNPDFVNAAKIYYNRFDMKVVPDTAKRSASVKTGQADDGAGGLDKVELKLNEGPTVKSYQSAITGCNFIAFNMNNPKWKDLRVRTAIHKAYDRQAIIDQLFGGDGSFNGPIPVGFGKWALSDKELRELNANKYDPAEAMKLWDAAGKPFANIDWYPPPAAIQPPYQPMAEIIAGALKKNLGIDKHTYKTDEYSVWLPKAYQGKAEDMTLGGWGDGAEPLNNLVWEYLPGGSRNFSNVNDAKVIQMIDDVIGTLDDAEAQKKSREIAVYVADKVVASVKPVIPNSYVIYNAKLRDYWPGIYPYGVDWRYKSWKAK